MPKAGFLQLCLPVSYHRLKLYSGKSKLYRPLDKREVRNHRKGLEKIVVLPVWHKEVVFAGLERAYILRSRGKSVFLQARTANKSAREMQDLIAGGRVVHTVVADLAVRWSTDLIGASGYSSVGLVSGPPYADALQKLRSQYDRLFLIVPGVGGQGMALRDARLAFDKFGHGAAVEAGRVTDAWRRAAASGGDPVQKARGAAERLRSELQQWVQVI